MRVTIVGRTYLLHANRAKWHHVPDDVSLTLVTPPTVRHAFRTYDVEPSQRWPHVVVPAWLTDRLSTFAFAPGPLWRALRRARPQLVQVDEEPPSLALLEILLLKRLLGYSSIAHAGYVMVAVAAHSEIGTAAAMFYLAAYAFMNVGAFAVIAHFARSGERYVNVEDFAGLGWKQPATAALLAVFLCSLIGVPLTGGFFGKFYIFKAALDANLVWLTVLGLLNSAVAAYYYLRVLVVMYMHEPGEAAETAAPLSAGLKTAVWVSALATLVLGIFPNFVLEFAGRSATLAR